MAITWFSNNEKKKPLIATISNSSITLNKYASDLISESYTVMLGCDYDLKCIYIKPLEKDLATKGTIPLANQYKITIRASYARVSNVLFIKQVKKIIGEVNLKAAPKKYACTYNENEKVLEINLNEEVI